MAWRMSVDAGQHRVDGDEVAARGVRDDARERRLARAGRAVEDDRADLVRLDGAAQQAARPDDLRLADELIQRARAHARSERRFLLGQLRAPRGKEVSPRLLGHAVILAQRRELEKR
jgi:hypothetical protein